MPWRIVAVCFYHHRQLCAGAVELVVSVQRSLRGWQHHPNTWCRHTVGQRGWRLSVVPDCHMQRRALLNGPD